MYARPAVRGRWHFWGLFWPVFVRHLRAPVLGTAPWHRRGLRIYAGRMNEAIRPGPENPPQACRFAAAFGRRPHLQRARQRHHAVSAAGGGARRRRLGSHLRRRQFPRRHLGRGARPGARRIAASAASAGSAGAACPAPASRASWPRSAPYAAVIDADLQHDETQLPKMLALLQSGEADLVVGSRYIEGGSADSFNKQRAGASALATEVAKRVLRVEIADPMSGFFMIRRDRFEQLAPQLSTQGFKILLDIVATARGNLRVDRNSLHLRRAAARREQARFHGGAGFPRPGAGEADPRRGVAALPAVRDGRLDRPGRASRDAVHRA